MKCEFCEFDLGDGSNQEQCPACQFPLGGGTGPDGADTAIPTGPSITREQPDEAMSIRFGSISLTKKSEVYRQRHVHVAFAADVSSSMSGSKSRELIGGLQRMNQELLPLRDRCRIGIVAFNERARVAHPMTTPKQLAGRIDIGRPNGATNMGVAIRLAGDLFDTPGNSKNADQLIALLSDGRDTCKSSPLEEAAQQKAAGRLILTIAYGADADLDTLREIASSPDLFFAKGTNGHELETFLRKLGDTMTVSVQMGQNLSRSLSRIN